MSMPSLNKHHTEDFKNMLQDINILKICALLFAINFSSPAAFGQENKLLNFDNISAEKFSITIIANDKVIGQKASFTVTKISSNLALTPGSCYVTSNYTIGRKKINKKSFLCSAMGGHAFFIISTSALLEKIGTTLPQKVVGNIVGLTLQGEPVIQPDE